MRKSLARVSLAMGLAAASGSALPTALSPDATGLWFDPAHPGWGLQVAQQGETVFAVLLTYDANHMPTWFVAPDVVQVANDITPPPPGPNFGGALYRTTGPAWSAPTFDPHSVAVTPVGELFMRYSSANEPRQLAVSYTVGNVSVSRILQPQTWSADVQDLIGQYGGGLFVTGPSRCPAAPLPLPVSPPQALTFGVTAGAPGHVNITWGSGIDLACVVDATYTRQGELATLQGSPACGPVGGGAQPAGTLTISAITSNASGFFGSAHLEMPQIQAETCVYDGTFGGVLTRSAPRSGMSPDPSGVWFDPAEPGWGLAITQQGGTSVALLFVYGADGKPAWFVASNVVDTGHAVNTLVQEGFAGTLYRTAGPYYGSDDDATPLGVTGVGTLQVAYIGATDKLALSYTIDGNAVNKTVQRETWSTNLALLSGTYAGGLFPPAPLCPGLQVFAPLATQFTVSAGTSSSSLTLTWTSGDNTCVMDQGAYAQSGQLASLSGPVRCGPIADPQAHVGNITISSMSVTQQGFGGFANFTADGCTAGGFMGGAKR